MPANFIAGLCVVLGVLAVVRCDFPATLRLERAFPINGRVELSQLRDRDMKRHGRLLQSSPEVVDFQVQGTYNPYRVGLYYTRVQLGTPAKEYYVQIDTGSDVLWVGCNGCSGCPTSTGLPIQLQAYDPSSSTTSSTISCSDQRCALGTQTSDSICSTSGNQCSFTFQYGDGSGSSGYYVADLMQLTTLVGSSVSSNTSASVVFGCSTTETGDLTKSDRAVDGIFGFGQQGLSVISQLYSQGIAPNVFSHCLIGTDAGGGILVLGEIMEPNVVYTPLVPSQPHYNLNLLSISINGQTLSIPSSVFSTSNSGGGTIVDSGTTLAYLAEAAYTPFVNAITQAVSQSVKPLVSKGSQCYLITSSVSEVFPSVSLNFAGGASMILQPEDYLLQQNSIVSNIGGASVWCIGIQEIQGQGTTILGDLVLKNKIVVYDIGGQRIGWANYDCSQSVNVSATTSSGKSEYVNTGQFSNSSSSRHAGYELIPIVILAFLLHIPTFGRSYFL